MDEQRNRKDFEVRARLPVLEDMIQNTGPLYIFIRKVFRCGIFGRLYIPYIDSRRVHTSIIRKGASRG